MLLFLFSASTGQEKTVVYDAPGTVLKNPWVGGMNACQYGAVDLDLDGNPDLVVFDRNGNRLMPFLWEGGEEYVHAPQYVRNFPELFEWAIFVDYDGDGKKDIFTYSRGYASMMVYRNVSQETLAFDRVVYPYLTSFQGGGHVNILVTYADYPGIYDLDGDGDLDILTFWGLGSFVELHLNLSMEKYGHADSLDFEKVDLCWGRFAESEESNEITLDTCFGGGYAAAVTSLLPHTGSTFMLGDLNGNGSTDLVLGDVDYPNLILLNNGGTGIEAAMISQDPLFPSDNVPVKLFSMPAALLIDIDHDGRKDMLVSPFDPNPYVVSNKESNWYYRNEGDDVVEYRLRKKDFLQEGMIDVGSGAYPVLVDYDHDGLLDLFIGNYGYYDSSHLDHQLILRSYYTSRLALFKNTGTAGQPEFSRISDDFAGLSALGLLGIYPAFADLDGDGDADMLVGNSQGTLLHFKNVANDGQPMEFVLEDDFFLEIDVGEYSAPVFADLDGDGLADLVVGERRGNLNYYRNTGNAGSFDLEFVTDSLGKVNVTDLSVSLDGFSTPSFFTDRNGNLGLLVGSEHGKIYQYGSIEGHLEGAFTENDSLFLALSGSDENTDRGMRTAAFAAYLRDSDELDLIAGNFSGGLEYFSNAIPPGADLSVEEKERPDLVSVFPVPATSELHFQVHGYPEVEIGEITLTDMSGRRKMGFHPSSGKFSIDTGALEDGVYLCRFIIKNSRGEVPVVKKIIILGRK